MTRSKPETAKILGERGVFRNRWLEVLERDVVFEPGTAPQQYYSLRVSDYVAIVAETIDGRVALVRQFRPAASRYVWELPAGMLEPDETPETCCRRELLEETGLIAETVRKVGTYFPDTGRLNNQLHLFHVQAGNPPKVFEEESGVSVAYVTRDELQNLVRSGDFPHLLHLAALYLVWGS